MDLIKEMVAYIYGNWYGILIGGNVLLFAAAFITRLTPTKKDDDLVKRISDAYTKILDFMKVPNIKKKDGTWIVPDGTHPPKDGAK